MLNGHVNGNEKVVCYHGLYIISVENESPSDSEIQIAPIAKYPEFVLISSEELTKLLQLSHN